MADLLNPRAFGPTPRDRGPRIQAPGGGLDRLGRPPELGGDLRTSRLANLPTYQSAATGTDGAADTETSSAEVPGLADPAASQTPRGLDRLTPPEGPSGLATDLGQVAGAASGLAKLTKTLGGVLEPDVPPRDEAAYQEQRKGERDLGTIDTDAGLHGSDRIDFGPLDGLGEVTAPGADGGTLAPPYDPALTQPFQIPPEVTAPGAGGGVDLNALPPELRDVLAPPDTTPAPLEPTPPQGLIPPEVTAPGAGEGTLAPPYDPAQSQPFVVPPEVTAPGAGGGVDFNVLPPALRDVIAPPELTPPDFTPPDAGGVDVSPGADVSPGDVSPETLGAINDAAAAIGGVAGIARIAAALAGDGSDVSKAVQSAGGAAAVYNAAAQLMGFEQIPYVQAVLAALQAAVAIAEAESPASAAAGAANAAMNVTPVTAVANFATMGKIGETVGHAFEDMGLGHEPSHGERERQEVAGVSPHVNNLIWEAQTASTPEELWQAITRGRGVAIQGNVGSLADLLADPSSYAASVQAGVTPDLLAPMDQGVTRTVQQAARLFQAAQAGVPEALAEVERRRGERSDFYAQGRWMMAPRTRPDTFNSGSEGSNTPGYSTTPGDPGWDPGFEGLMDALAGFGGGRGALSRYTTNPAVGPGSAGGDPRALLAVPAELAAKHPLEEVAPALYSLLSEAGWSGYEGGTGVLSEDQTLKDALARLEAEIERQRQQELARIEASQWSNSSS